jgi:serine/threonine-protein phosphatase PGAM5
MLYESCCGNKLVFCAGRVQADLTGHRLKALGLPYMHILHSPMTRARQTADIIHKHLPAVTMQECDLIQEGAPYPPEPPSDLWKPEPKVFE